MGHHILIFSYTKLETQSLFTFDELFPDMENKIIFTACWSIFFTFLPHRTYSFSGPCFCSSLSSWFPLSPSLCRSDRGDGGCCQPSVNNTGDFLDVYQLPLSFIKVHLFITGLCTIYLCDAHCACHKESFFIVNSKEPAL